MKEERQQIKERSQTNLLSGSHPFQRSSLISNHRSNSKLDSCEIPDKSSVPDLFPTPTFVQAEEGRCSSSLANVAVGSNAFIGSPPLQDNEKVTRR